MNLLVSACLLGCACRYDGGAKPCAAVRTLAAKHTLIPVCPEIYGGLPTPRTPCEIVGDRVLAVLPAAAARFTTAASRGRSRRGTALPPPRSKRRESPFSVKTGFPTLKNG